MKNVFILYKNNIIIIMNINANDLNKKKKNTIMETFIKDEIKKIEKKIILANDRKIKYISYQVQKPLNHDYTIIVTALNNELVKNKFKTSVYENGVILVSW